MISSARRRTVSARVRMRTPVLAAVLVCACAGEPAGEPVRRGGTAIIVAADDIDLANPLVTSGRYTEEILRYALFLPLLTYDESIRLQPALAREWTLEGDTAVEFRLRDDVYWHDGAHTTAWDVAFTFERMADPETAYPNVDRIQGWGPPQVVDSFTVRFPLDVADPLSSVPFMPIVPRHLLEATPPNEMRQAAFNRAPVGNGPFRFVEGRANDRWVFEANPEFPEGLGGPPLLSRVIWRVVPEGTAEIAELATGNAHLALSVPVPQVVPATRDADLRVLARESSQYGFVAWNGRRRPFHDPRVRRALTLALDRQELIDGLRDGHGSIADGPVGHWHWAFDATLEPNPHAPDSARALLDAAGVVDRDGDGVRERPDGTPFTVELLVPNNAFNRDLGEVIRADLAEVGIRITVQPRDGATIQQAVVSPERDFDAFLFGWATDYRLDLRGLYHSAEIDGPLQFAGYRNAAVDSILDALADERDRDRARAHYRGLQRALREDPPWTYLFFYPDVYLASPRLHGVEMDIRGALVDLPRWWIETDQPVTAAK